MGPTKTVNPIDLQRGSLPFISWVFRSFALLAIVFCSMVLVFTIHGTWN